MNHQYAWHIYGNFQPRHDGFPLRKEVVSCYRLQREYSFDALARALGWSESDVVRIELGQDTLEDRERRRVLAECLQIPPLLLGLPPFDWSLNALEEQRTLNTELTESEKIQQFNERVACCGGLDQATMESYFAVLYECSSSVKSPSYRRNLEYWLQIVSSCMDNASGFQRDQYAYLLFEFYQEASLLREGDALLFAYDKSLEYLQLLNNVEELAMVYALRMGLYLQRKDREPALQDLENAVYYAELFYQSMNQSDTKEHLPALKISNAYVRCKISSEAGQEQRRLRRLHSRVRALAELGRNIEPREVFEFFIQLPVQQVPRGKKEAP